MKVIAPYARRGSALETPIVAPYIGAGVHEQSLAP